MPTRATEAFAFPQQTSHPSLLFVGKSRIPRSSMLEVPSRSHTFGYSSSLRVSAEDVDNLEETTAEVDVELLLYTVNQLKGDVSEASERTALAEETVMSLQQRVEEAQAELEAKELEIKESSDFWSMEKAKLMAKVAEFTGLLQNKDTELDRLNQANPELVALQEALQKEVQDLKMALVEAERTLQEEREAATEMQERLFKAEDNLEFEQNRFQKEKKELADRIQEEKTKLGNVKAQFQKEQTQFEQERAELKKKVQEEIARLTDVKGQLEQEQKRFTDTKNELEQTIADQTNQLQETQKELKSERNRFAEGRAELERKVTEEKAKLSKTEQELKSERNRFKREKDDLVMRIGFEKQKLSKLEQDLENEQTRFLNEKTAMNTRLQEETQRLEEVEAELESETLRFTEEKDELEETIEEGNRVRTLKARQMSERFKQIRAEMTSLLVQAKKDARSDERRLKEKYEGKIAERNSAVAQLEGDLVAASVAMEESKSKLQMVMAEKQLALQEQVQMEKRFIAKIAKSNQQILTLTGTVSNLKTEISVRDEKIEQYETSFRQLFGLSAKLAKQRLRKRGARVVQKLARQKKDNDDDSV
eukprot:scaffold28410_cov51-Attheya_sp.AAC.7